MTCILAACTHIQAILTLEDSDELRSAEVGIQTSLFSDKPIGNPHGMASLIGNMMRYMLKCGDFWQSKMKNMI